MRVDAYKIPDGRTLRLMRVAGMFLDFLLHEPSGGITMRAHSILGNTITRRGYYEGSTISGST